MRDHIVGIVFKDGTELTDIHTGTAVGAHIWIYAAAALIKLGYGITGASVSALAAGGALLRINCKHKVPIEYMANKICLSYNDDELF